MITVEKRKLKELAPYANNARTHSESQVNEIAQSILNFGYNDPITIDETGTILTGHGTTLALERLVSSKPEFETVDVVVLSHLSPRQKKAYILAHNQLALKSGWDTDKLADELSELVELDFDIDTLGFDEQFVDGLLKQNEALLPETKTEAEEPIETAPRASRSKGKIVHTCPKCSHEFTA